MKQPTETKLYNFRMDPALIERMKQAAEQDRRSLTQEVVVAVESFLESKRDETP